VPLTLETRQVGAVTIVKCNGRIVLGAEATALLEHVDRMLHDTRDIVLHLEAVDFIDSSGLGVMVRLLTRTQAVHGDLKLCNVSSHAQQALEATRISTLFDAHPTEMDAVAAFYRPGKSANLGNRSGTNILCVDKSVDLLAYLRGLLQQAGYAPLVTGSLHDARILLGAAKPKLLILGAGLRSAQSAQTAEAFKHAIGSLPVIDLPSDFSTTDAATAARQLLEQVQALIGAPEVPSASA
jgi:anti-sigma B factor antagonist